MQSTEDISFPENNIVCEHYNNISKDPRLENLNRRNQNSQSDYFIDRLDSIDQKDFNVFGDTQIQPSYKFPSPGNLVAPNGQFSSFVNSNIST